MFHFHFQWFHCSFWLPGKHLEAIWAVTAALPIKLHSTALTLQHVGQIFIDRLKTKQKEKYDHNLPQPLPPVWNSERLLVFMRVQTGTDGTLML